MWIVDNMVGKVVAYGGWGNVINLRNMKSLDEKGKKAYVKKLWEEDPEKYYEWKAWCIELDQLPDFFGTSENPIDIDESKL